MESRVRELEKRVVELEEKVQEQPTLKQIMSTISTEIKKALKAINF
ncbi:hypothetical protein ACFLKC_14300 [Clostridium caseinilyticum]